VSNIECSQLTTRRLRNSHLDNTKRPKKVEGGWDRGKVLRFVGCRESPWSTEGTRSSSNDEALSECNRRPFSFGKTVRSCTGLKIWLERRTQDCQEKKLVGLRWKLLFGAWMLLAAITWTCSERHCPAFSPGACNCIPAMLEDGLWLVAAALGRVCSDDHATKSSPVVDPERWLGAQSKAEVSVA
jgi:hypothetical protein